MRKRKNKEQMASFEESIIKKEIRGRGIQCTKTEKYWKKAIMKKVEQKGEQKRPRH